MNGIGIKKDNIVYIGCDSISYTAHSTSYVPTNMMLFSPSKAKHTFVCYINGGRLADLIRTEDKLVEEGKLENGRLTCDYIMNHSFPSIIDLHYKYHVLDEDTTISDIGGDFLFMKDDVLISLDPFGNIREIETSRCVGRSQEFFQALIDSIDEKYDPTYRILKAFTIHSEVGMVCYPICIVNSKEQKIKTYSLYESINYINEYEAKEGIK